MTRVKVSTTIFFPAKIYIRPHYFTQRSIFQKRLFLFPTTMSLRVIYR